MIKIEALKNPDREIFEKIKELLIQLYPNNFPLEYGSFEKVVSGKAVKVFVAIEKKRIVGVASLVIYEKLSGKVAMIEDVVVDAKFRGKGIGTRLTRGMMDDAKNNGCKFIDVNTRREDAKEFYIKLGFSEKNKDRPFFALRYSF